jgi:hypothetical protein
MAVSMMFGRDGPLLVDARQPCGRDAQQANEYARQNDPSGRCPHNLGHEFTPENGRDQCTEGGAQAQHHSHPQRQSQVAHGQAEGKSANAPEQREEKRPEKNCAGCFVKDRQQVLGHEQSKEPGGNDPAENPPARQKVSHAQRFTPDRAHKNCRKPDRPTSDTSRLLRDLDSYFLRTRISRPDHSPSARLNALIRLPATPCRRLPSSWRSAPRVQAQARAQNTWPSLPASGDSPDRSPARPTPRRNP